MVDLQLDTAGPGCADWLHVFDGLKSVTLCGRRARRLLATSARQQLQVRFHSNQQHRPKGFWLYYEGMDSDEVIQLLACSYYLWGLGALGYLPFLKFPSLYSPPANAAWSVSYTHLTLPTIYSV